VSKITKKLSEGVRFCWFGTHITVPYCQKHAILSKTHSYRLLFRRFTHFQFWSYFLTDKIARKADAFDCHVIEVGSGPGSLSRSLLNAGTKHLHAVEIDERFMPSLEVNERLHFTKDYFS